jgi:hypothetical protein
MLVIEGDSSAGNACFFQSFSVPLWMDECSCTLPLFENGRCIRHPMEEQPNDEA